MPRALPILIASALIVSVAAPASAQLINRVERERVYYGDLDLYNAKDADLLLDRVDNAAYDVCGGDQAVGRYERNASADCADESTQRAVRQLDHPMVNARHEGLSPEVVIAEGDAAYPSESVK